MNSAISRKFCINLLTRSFKGTSTSDSAGVPLPLPIPQLFEEVVPRSQLGSRLMSQGVQVIQGLR